MLAFPTSASNSGMPRKMRIRQTITEITTFIESGSEISAVSMSRHVTLVYSRRVKKLLTHQLSILRWVRNGKLQSLLRMFMPVNSAVFVLQSPYLSCFPPWEPFWNKAERADGAAAEGKLSEQTGVL